MASSVLHAGMMTLVVALLIALSPSTAQALLPLLDTPSSSGILGPLPDLPPLLSTSSSSGILQEVIDDVGGLMSSSGAVGGVIDGVGEQLDAADIQLLPTPPVPLASDANSGYTGLTQRLICMGRTEDQVAATLTNEGTMVRVYPFSTGSFGILRNMDTIGVASVEILQLSGTVSSISLRISPPSALATTVSGAFLQDKFWVRNGFFAQFTVKRSGLLTDTPNGFAFVLSGLPVTTLLVAQAESDVGISGLKNSIAVVFDYKQNAFGQAGSSVSVHSGFLEGNSAATHLPNGMLTYDLNTLDPIVVMVRWIPLLDTAGSTTETGRFLVTLNATGTPSTISVLINNLQFASLFDRGLGYFGWTSSSSATSFGQIDVYDMTNLRTMHVSSRYSYMQNRLNPEGQTDGFAWPASYSQPEYPVGRLVLRDDCNSSYPIANGDVSANVFRGALVFDDQIGIVQKVASSPAPGYVDIYMWAYSTRVKPLQAYEVTLLVGGDGLEVTPPLTVHFQTALPNPVATLDCPGIATKRDPLFLNIFNNLQQTGSASIGGVPFLEGDTQAIFLTPSVANGPEWSSTFRTQRVRIANGFLITFRMKHVPPAVGPMLSNPQGLALVFSRALPVVGATQSFGVEELGYAGIPSSLAVVFDRNGFEVHTAWTAPNRALTSTLLPPCIAEVCPGPTVVLGLFDSDAEDVVEVEWTPLIRDDPIDKTNGTLRVRVDGIEKTIDMDGPRFVSLFEDGNAFVGWTSAADPDTQGVLAIYDIHVDIIKVDPTSSYLAPVANAGGTFAAPPGRQWWPFRQQPDLITPKPQGRYIAIDRCGLPYRMTPADYSPTMELHFYTMAPPPIATPSLQTRSVANRPGEFDLFIWRQTSMQPTLLYSAIKFALTVDGARVANSSGNISNIPYILNIGPGAPSGPRSALMQMPTTFLQTQQVNYFTLQMADEYGNPAVLIAGWRLKWGFLHDPATMKTLDGVDGTALQADTGRQVLDFITSIRPADAKASMFVDIINLSTNQATSVCGNTFNQFCSPFIVQMYNGPPTGILSPPLSLLGITSGYIEAGISVDVTVSLFDTAGAPLTIDATSLLLTATRLNYTSPRGWHVSLPPPALLVQTPFLITGDSAAINKVQITTPVFQVAGQYEMVPFVDNLIVTSAGHTFSVFAGPPVRASLELGLNKALQGQVQRMMSVNVYLFDEFDNPRTLPGTQAWTMMIVPVVPVGLPMSMDVSCDPQAITRITTTGLAGTLQASCMWNNGVQAFVVQFLALQSMDAVDLRWGEDGAPAFVSIGSVLFVPLPGSSTGGNDAAVVIDPCAGGRVCGMNGTCSSVAIGALPVAYCTPVLVISQLTPSTVSSEGGAVITVTMANTIAPSMAVSFAGKPVAIAVTAANRFEFTVPSPSVSGIAVEPFTRGVSVGLEVRAVGDASGTSGLTPGVEFFRSQPNALLLVNSTCIRVGWFWVVSTDACVPCNPNAYCPGGARSWPLRGFYASSEDQQVPVECLIDEACQGFDPERANDVSNLFEPSLQCGSGYQDLYCSQCQSTHFMENQRCRSCGADGETNRKLISTIVAALVVFALMAIGVAFITDERLSLYVTIIVFVQQCSFVGSMGSSRIDAPGASEFFSILALLNFEVSYFKIGCSVPQISFLYVFWGIMAMVAIAAIMLVAASALFAKTRTDGYLEEKGNLDRWKVMSRRVQNSMTVLGVVVYLQLTTQFIKGLHCVTIEGAFFWFGLFFYSIGFPILCFYLVWRTTVRNVWESSASKFIYLYRGLRIRYIFFKSVNFITSFALALQISLSVTSNTAIRLITAILFFSLNCFLVGVCWPYINRFPNMLAMAAGIGNALSGLAILTILSGQVGRESAQLGMLTGWPLFGLGLSVLVVLLLAIPPVRLLKHKYFPTTKGAQEQDIMLQEGRFEELTNTRAAAGQGAAPNKGISRLDGKKLPSMSGNEDTKSIVLEMQPQNPFNQPATLPAVTFLTVEASADFSSPSHHLPRQSIDADQPYGSVAVGSNLLRGSIAEDHFHQRIASDSNAFAPLSPTSRTRMADGQQGSEEHGSIY